MVFGKVNWTGIRDRQRVLRKVDYRFRQNRRLFLAPGNIWGRRDVVALFFHLAMTSHTTEKEPEPFAIAVDNTGDILNMLVSA